MNRLDAECLKQRYVSVWTEADPAARRTAIEQLWSEDGAIVLHPPVELRDAAAALGFTDATLEAHGYDAIQARVTRAYEEFVAPGEFSFRASEPAVRLHDVVKLRWEMVPIGGGESVGAGVDVLVLDGSGKVRTSYQFPDP